MALALDATVGGASANAYADRAAANAYFDGRAGADAWTAAADTDGGARDQALVAATSRLEQERYQGMKVTTTQRLQWPRAATYDPDGYLYPTTSIPRPVQEACFELALAILATPSLLGGNALSQFSDLTVGPIHLGVRQGETNPDLLPAPVERLLRDLKTSAVGMRRLVRT